MPPDAFGKHQHTEADDAEETKWDENEEVRTKRALPKRDAPLQETPPMRFPELERQIAAAIAEYGLAFPKLNWSAPRVRLAVSDAASAEASAGCELDRSRRESALPHAR